MLRRVRNRTIGTMIDSQPPESFQIPIEAAEAYEASFVPAFFAQWAPILCEAAGVKSGQRVLDVACGTGIVARTAAEIVGEDGVVGADLNEAMLSVARRVRPGIEWHRADAAALPFEDCSFDRVMCQMALMFLPDRVAALREMARVTARAGTVTVLVPAGLERQPAYGPFVEMAARQVGGDARSLLGAYFSCGDPGQLVAWLAEAGLPSARVAQHVGTARFPSVEALVATEVGSTPLGERISPEVHDGLVEGARDVLDAFTAEDGSLSAPFEVHVVVARRS